MYIIISMAQHRKQFKKNKNNKHIFFNFTKSTSFSSFRVFILQFYMPFNTADTIDCSSDYTKDNGFIMFQNYINHKGLFSVDQGSADKIIFMGKYKEVIDESKAKSDFHLYNWKFMESKADSLQSASISEGYIDGSLEENGIKEYGFFITMPKCSYYFFTTEVIVDKNDKEINSLVYHKK